MTKKLITISVFLGLAVIFGFGGCVKAVGDEVVFSADTTVDIYEIGTTSASDLVVEANSQVTTFVRGTDNVSITLDTDSDITFKSAGNQIMTVTGCTAAQAVFTAGTTSTMRIQYDATNCTSAVLTIGTGGLTEGNVKAVPLTAGALAADTEYTVTFRTVSALTDGQKVKLVFGTGYGIATYSTDETRVVITDVTIPDIPTTVTPSAFSSSGTTNEVVITLPDVVAGRVLNIVLSDTVTNPSTLTHNAAGDPDLPTLGIDIYTTTDGDVTIDALADQTPYNRIIELKTGWNVFAPSQALETPAYATVLLPIYGSYDAIYTLVRGTGTMEWLSPTNIEPLFGYAIYITAGSTVELPLDFAKEGPTNFAFSRELTYKGWFLIGYAGNTGQLDAYIYCLDGLVGTGVNGTDAYDTVVDLTGAGVSGGEVAQTNHFWSATPTEDQNAGNMDFTKDYGFAISVNTIGMTLTGNREE